MSMNHVCICGPTYHLEKHAQSIVNNRSFHPEGIPYAHAGPGRISRYSCTFGSFRSHLVGIGCGSLRISPPFTWGVEPRESHKPGWTMDGSWRKLIQLQGKSHATTPTPQSPTQTSLRGTTSPRWKNPPKVLLSSSSSPFCLSQVKLQTFRDEMKMWVLEVVSHPFSPVPTEDRVFFPNFWGNLELQDSPNPTCFFLSARSFASKFLTWL